MGLVETLNEFGREWMCAITRTQWEAGARPERRVRGEGVVTFRHRTRLQPIAVGRAQPLTRGRRIPAREVQPRL
jgi:hypothetical protein